MAPTHHLLQATLPLRSSIASLRTPPRSALLPPTLRSASTTTRNTNTNKPTRPSKQRSRKQTSSTTTTISSSSSSTPSTPTNAPLQPPPRIRTYATTLKVGTVVSVGLMDRTVRVCHKHTEWDGYIHKTYPKKTHFLVSDPRNSLREGDIIEFSSGTPKSRRVHHVVERIITPFGSAVEGRPPVMTAQEREMEREKSWAEKYLRRESRRLGREVDLLAEAGVTLQQGQEKPSAVELIHRIHGQKERVGKVKGLVLKRSGSGAAEVESA